MFDMRKTTENVVTVKTVETDVETVVQDAMVSYEIRRVRTATTTILSQRSAQKVKPFYNIREEPQEEPSAAADLDTRITDMPTPTPSEHAEVKVSLVDGEGRVKVPGRFAGRLLNGCVAVGCAVSAGVASRWVIEASGVSLQDWTVLTITGLLVGGTGLMAWYAMRRR